MQNVKPFEGPIIPEGLHREPVILVVDDEVSICKLLQYHLKRSGCSVLIAQNGNEALRVLNEQPMVDLVVLDLHLPGVSGLDTLRAINRTGKVASVIVMTAYGTLENAVAALREGSYDFVTKSASFDDLRLAIRNALHTIGLKEEVETLKARLSEKEEGIPEIIGSGEKMQQVMKLARKVADSDITVLLEGESGTGKEMIARAIHNLRASASKPFVALDCAAIPEHLLESELFGHERGAFTGATNKRIGSFEEAHEGTLFLDEVGELGLGLQAKFLRVLQTHEFQPIGGRVKKVNVRVVSATNQNLAEKVRQGSFRQDLYYRLAVFPILLPPLRERPEDIPLLLNHFLRKFAAQEQKQVDGIALEARRKLRQHNWPGNVRELENMIYRAVVLAETHELRAEDFPMFSLPPPAEETALPEAEPARPGFTRSREALSMQEIEIRAIREALDATGGNISRAAEALRIGRATLYRKLKKFGLPAS